VFSNTDWQTAKQFCFLGFGRLVWARVFRTARVDHRGTWGFQRSGDFPPSLALLPQTDASARLNTRGGRPRRVPLAFAARTPARTGSPIISRSISANAANKCKRKRDMGLSALVSIPSFGLRNRIPRPASSWIVRTQCATLRPQRSSFQTSTASNRCSRALCSSGAEHDCPLGAL
jgi:hypothetical protein